MTHAERLAEFAVRTSYENLSEESLCGWSASR